MKKHTHIQIRTHGWCAVGTINSGAIAEFCESVNTQPDIRPPRAVFRIVFSVKVLVAIDGAPVPGGHFASVSDCRRSLDSVAYPCTLTFRDMPKYIWLSRVLAMRSPT